MTWKGLLASLAISAMTIAGPMPSLAQQTGVASGKCKPFTWTTLGTAGGPVPTPTRGEPSNLLRAGDLRVIVDAGDGTVNNLARIGVDTSRVQTVFISHHHADHYGGLLAVIGLAWMTNYPGQLQIYGPPGTKELVQGLLAALGPQSRVGYATGKLPPPSKMVRVTELSDKDSVTIGDVKVTARANTHFAAEDGSEPVDAISLSYRFDFEGRSITYTGDTGPSKAVTQLATGSDLLVSEIIDYNRLVTYMHQARPNMPKPIFEQIALHLRNHHLSGEQVGEMAGKADVRKVVLTHFATPPFPIGGSSDSILAGIREHFSGDVDLASDLATYDVGCNAG